MSRTIDDLERLAMKNVPLPDDLTLPEQMLFLSLRQLHASYRNGEITKERARKEKQMIVVRYRDAVFRFSVYDETVHRHNEAAKLYPDIAVSGCALCKMLAAVMDGRIQKV